MEFNLVIVAIAALIPTILGFIWYNPKVFGTVWMNACGFTTEDLKGGNMIVIFVISLILSLMLASSLPTMVIHQNGFFQTLMNEPDLAKEGTEIYQYTQDFINKYGANFRTFKHGALHGAMAGIFFVLPVLGTNALFERKGFKYIAINVGYWTVCLALMGGMICEFT
ncbi:DUF1761 domain-containing protein [Aquimarina sp. BL5]|uniref:DUF1761 domain-containing protein n=1 Tax=Aquimarina sp. BL5 TaxID=1714860 RepID=UPI000E4A2764|nr:DUF1761 domain-containing protein [Aquimarina sp. BL5]AXT50436.1 DUF1761 domain-containing protein [Aquimarina sp. BL5]RKN03088.1 DUF1761 family protein [Aquimarina sp. BL5]